MPFGFRPNRFSLSVQTLRFSVTIFLHFILLLFCLDLVFSLIGFPFFFFFLRIRELSVFKSTFSVCQNTIPEFTLVFHSTGSQTDSIPTFLISYLLTPYYYINCYIHIKIASFPLPKDQILLDAETRKMP